MCSVQSRALPRGTCFPLTQPWHQSQGVGVSSQLYSSVLFRKATLGNWLLLQDSLGQALPLTHSGLVTLGRSLSLSVLGALMALMERFLTWEFPVLGSEVLGPAFLLTLFKTH